MKRNNIKSLLAKLLGLALALTLTALTAAGQAGRSGEFLITTLENELVASIKISGQQTVVELSGEQLFGVAKRAEKRKYFNTADQLTYAVKYGEGSFKLRDANEQLLWKVKVYDSYIKLSDNEEMNNAFRIAFSDSGKLKVKREGEELEAIRYDRAASRFKAGDFFLVNFKNSLATGILLMEDLPRDQRIILAAEILRAGK